ncbi:MAG: hypothetical protein HY033_11415 [Ignavibacteriae bacterium]|nr:hypothetical protein [Ignavibacteria bacterium]MBI3365505.1 hypothetical protein [Ignavibacteriota bacterium]
MLLIVYTLFYQAKEIIVRNIFILLILSSSLCPAQGLYVNRGQSATMLQVSYASTQHATAEGILIGHSFKETFDVGLTAGIGNGTGSNSDLTFWGPTISLYMLNPDSSTGPVLAVDAAYTSLNFGSTYSPYGYGSRDITGSTFLIGGTAGARLQLAPSVAIEPLVEAGTSNTSVENISQSAGFYGFGLSWILRAGKATRIVLTPSVSVANSISTFGIDGGIVFLQ